MKNYKNPYEAPKLTKKQRDSISINDNFLGLIAGEDGWYVKNNDGTFRLLTENNAAIGTGSIAGGKGYKIVETGTNTYKLRTVEGLEVGMEYSVILNEADYCAGTIKSINSTNKTITVSTPNKYPLNPNLDNPETFNVYNFLIITGRPDLGDIEVGFNCFAAGEGAIACNKNAISLGTNTKALGKYSLAEGINTIAGDAAHAEGNGTQATREGAHSEGRKTIADAPYAHAQGNETQANGVGSDASGYGTIASRDYSMARGKYNEIDEDKKYMDIVGNGTDEKHRLNIYTLDHDGNSWFAGNVFVGKINDKLATEKFVNENKVDKADKSYVNDSFANAPKGLASGKILSISDTSPVEHTMDVKIRGKNLFDINRPVRTFEASAYVDGDSLVVKRTNTTNTPSSAYITLGWLALLIGKTVTLSFKNDSAYEFGLSIIGGTRNTNAINPPNFIGTNVSPNSTVKLTFTVPAITGATELRFIIQSKNNDINTGEIYRLSNIQFEEGTEATEYEPYVDVGSVNVTRWGKNLCDVAKTKQSVNFNISTEGESLLLERPDTTKTSTVYVPIGELSSLIGKTLTLSFKNESEHNIAVAVGGGSDYNLWYPPTSYIGVSVSANSTAKKTFTVPDIAGATELRFMIQTTANSETEGKSYKISNIQCEVGTEVTEYESYKEPTTYVPNADGVVEGVTSYYPTTTLMTDASNAVIDCEYNRDINKVLGDIEMLLGGI